VSRMRVRSDTERHGSANDRGVRDRGVRRPDRLRPRGKRGAADPGRDRRPKPRAACMARDRVGGAGRDLRPPGGLRRAGVRSPRRRPGGSRPRHGTPKRRRAGGVRPDLVRHCRDRRRLEPARRRRRAERHRGVSGGAEHARRRGDDPARDGRPARQLLVSGCREPDDRRARPPGCPAASAMWRFSRTSSPRKAG